MLRRSNANRRFISRYTVTTVGILLLIVLLHQFDPIPSPNTIPEGVSIQLERPVYKHSHAEQRDARPASVALHRSEANEPGRSLCPVLPSSFSPLTTFTFWGKPMNRSSPCPTAGMNNQVVMILALMHCATQQSGYDLFKFKDITCSPTGGKEGKKQYRVGSEDYSYTWFRWTEVFRVGVLPQGKRLCLADEYSWSEHAWMKKCPTFVDQIYGKKGYWDLRGALRLHPWFDTLAADFLTEYAQLEEKHPSHAKGPQRRQVLHQLDGGRSEPSSSGDSQSVEMNFNEGEDLVSSLVFPFIAMHVRRGDYENFCRQTSKTSGKSKFRTAPYLWLRRSNSTELSKKFMTACFPSLTQIVGHTKTLRSKFPHINKLFVATNSKSFLDAFRFALRNTEGLSQLKVITFAEFLETPESAKLLEAYWPRRQGSDPSSRIDAPVLTEAELSMMDVNIISMAEVMVLNRYSTFSQSAVDFRVLRTGDIAGMNVHWW